MGPVDNKGLKGETINLGESVPAAVPGKAIDLF